MSDHTHTNEAKHRERKAIALAFIINTVFVIVELYGAYSSGSLTLLADAFHMVTDSLSLLLALVASYVTVWAADNRRTFGYQRVEVIGGFFNALFLIGTVLFILFDAYNRYQTIEPVKSNIVVLIGVFGLLANVLAAYVLHGKNSLNARSAYLHLIADAAGSIGAIIAGVIIYFTNLYIVDIIFALVIAVLISYSVFSVLRESINIFLQGRPSEVPISEIESLLLDITGVEDVHHIHIWSLDSESIAVSAHIVKSQSAEYPRVLETALDSLVDYGIDHPTIQIESTDFSPSQYDCQK